jgi:hypothetical protein
VNKLRSTGLLIDKKQKHKSLVLTEEKLGDIGARLEHTPIKSLKRLTQEAGVSESSARRATELLKLRSYKTTVIHARLAAARTSWDIPPCSLLEVNRRFGGTSSAMQVLFVLCLIIRCGFENNELK